MVGGTDILVKAGVAGDLREDWEDMEAISAREDEFFRDEAMVEPDLSLREKRPMLAGEDFVVLCTYRWEGGGFRVAWAVDKGNLMSSVSRTMFQWQK
jgi:hypothetical protein